ncbi:NAD(P)-binding protein [Auricularia subglabra TFB-10046 SS5]|nr:NAD(P)-binding protein [Auricularia subglabra TFB-10046 SS5]
MSSRTQFTARQWRISDPPTGFDALRLQEAPVGELGPSDVLVKVKAVSLQFRDMVISKGIYSLPVKPSAVLGSDAAGEVVAVGSGVSKWRAGDRVASNFNILHIHGDLTTATAQGTLGAAVDGVLSTYKIFPAEALVRVPEHLSYEEASTLPCAAVTAYNALLSGPQPLKGGDTVLIEGTGGVSIFALQLVLASGAVPIVLTSSEAKIAAVRKLGAEHVINYKEVPDWDVEVRKLTGGEGVDHVIEVSGGQTLDKALRSVRLGGTISAIGIVDNLASSPDLFIQCIVKGVVIRGIQIGSRTQFENLNKLLAARKVHPVVDRVFPFEQLADALKYLESQKHVGKVVIEVT